MTTPSQLSIALPSQFGTSFWSAPNYRRGVQSLYARLQTGIDENHNLIQIIQHRADAEFAHADNLATQANRNPYPAQPLFKQALAIANGEPDESSIYSNDDIDHSNEYDLDDLNIDSRSSSSSRTFVGTGSDHRTRARGESNLAISHAIRAIETESLLTQANAHAKVAHNLERTVLQPFRKWSSEHRERITSSWNHVDAAVQRFERQHVDTEKLRAQYENKCRLADEADDDARFAPSAPTPNLDHGAFQANTSTSQSSASTGRTAEPSDTTAPSIAQEKAPPAPLDSSKIQRRETIRQQFGFAARSPGAQGDGAARSVSAANSTSAETGDGFGQFGGVTVPVASPDSSSGRRSLGSQRQNSGSAEDNLDDVPLGSLNSSSLKRSATLSSYLSSAVGRISGESASSLAASVKGLVGGLSEPRHIRARREAESAERAYADAVIGLDRTRCALEEILAEHFALLQRFEMDRLKAVKAVLSTYQSSFAQLLPALGTSFARMAKVQESLVPEADLQRIIAEGRTGAYKPVAQVFHPYYHDDRASLAGEGSGGFGMNLDAYTRAEALAREDSSATEGAQPTAGSAGGGHSRNPSLVGAQNKKGMPAVPLVLGTLLSALERAYADPKRWPQPARKETRDAEKDTGKDESSLLLASAEKRKSWIYEVPLPAIHRLRDVLVEPHLLRAIAALSEDHHLDAPAAGDPRPAVSPSNLDLDRYDPPVLAATLKVWALELEQSLIPSELWDSAAAIYEAAAGQEREARAKKAAAAAPPAESAAATADPSAATAEDGAAAAEEKEPKTPTAAAAGEKGKGRLSNVGPNGAPLPEPLDPEVEAKIRADVIQDLTALLSKLPKIHLACLDAIVEHLHRMVKGTTTNEPELVYLNKLGLSIGRAILRPKVETPATINAKHPTLLAMDLIQHYEAIFPGLLARKARESELSAARKMPIRKRTKPIDQRLSRSQMQAQFAASQNKGVPPLPTASAAAAATAVSKAATNVADGAKRLGQTIVTNVEQVISTASPLSGNSANQDLRGGATEAGEDGDAVPPTPIASRVLQGARSDTLKAGPGSEKSAGSAPVVPAAAATPAAAAPASSNVARLSRQFGGSAASSGTAATGVRGPRPAGARTARPSGGSSIGAADAPSERRKVDRESKDLTPSNELGDDLKRSRRRSWSRTVDSSDALAAATGDDEDDD
ncbi:Rho-GTPase-activating protein 8 [Tilletia horrida]|nr:Rho-GTPase-activating protein 8 [Tilletia horrida]